MKPLRDKIYRSTVPEFRRYLSFGRAASGNDAGLYGMLSFWLGENTK